MLQCNLCSEKDTFNYGRHKWSHNNSTWSGEGSAHWGHSSKVRTLKEAPPETKPFFVLSTNYRITDATNKIRSAAAAAICFPSISHIYIESRHDTNISVSGRQMANWKIVIIWIACVCSVMGVWDCVSDSAPCRRARPLCAYRIRIAMCAV